MDTCNFLAPVFYSRLSNDISLVNPTQTQIKLAATTYHQCFVLEKSTIARNPLLFGFDVEILVLFQIPNKKAYQGLGPRL